MKKITRGLYDPALGKQTPRRDHGSREAVERAGHSVRVINRGEQLSYIDASMGEVVAEVSIPGDWIDADTLALWDFDPARPINAEERDKILERIARFWLGYTKRSLKVIRGSEQHADPA